MHWTYRLLSDREWSGRHTVSLNPAVNGISLSRSSLDAAFDEEGRQVGPLMARVSGAVAGLTQLFIHCGWQMDPLPGNAPADIWRLSAETAVKTGCKESGAELKVTEVGQ